MEVIVGTYEELILGYKLHLLQNVCTFETSFTDHSHTGCVRTVAVSENGILASGSSDESIKLFNLKKRKEVGTLLQHEGYVSCLTFFGKSHMFSCSEDGTIVIWKMGKWECEKTLRGHKNAVNYVTVHPSGKMALSVSQNKMFTWNLLTGKCAYKTSLKSGADILKWTPDGKRYLVVKSNVIDVYSVETASVEESVSFNFRINCVDFIKDDIMIVGGEGGKVQFYSLPEKQHVFTMNTETTRVKGIGVCTCDTDKEALWITTGSSDGWIKVWKVCQNKGKWSSSLEASIDTKFRIVSLAIHSEKSSPDISNTNNQIAAVKRVPKQVQIDVDNSDISSNDDSTDEEVDSEEDSEDTKLVASHKNKRSKQKIDDFDSDTISDVDGVSSDDANCVSDQTQKSNTKLQKLSDKHKKAQAQKRKRSETDQKKEQLLLDRKRSKVVTEKRNVPKSTGENRKKKNRDIKKNKKNKQKQKKSQKKKNSIYF